MRTSVFSFACNLRLGFLAGAVGLSFTACGNPDDGTGDMMDQVTSPTGDPTAPTTPDPTNMPPQPPPQGVGGMGGQVGPGTGGTPSTMPEPADAAPVRSTTGPSYATTVEPIFSEKCTPSCHEPGGILGGPGGIDKVKMDLTAGHGYATLTSGKSIQLATMWVVGSGLEDSYLWHKLTKTEMELKALGGEGATMPVTGEITAAELAVVQAWIEGGASP